MRRHQIRLDGRHDLSVYRTLRAVEAAEAEQPTVAGLAERRPCETDRRRMRVALTADGQEALQKLRGVRLDLLAELTAGWAPQDVDRLATLLDRLFERARELGR